MASESLYCAVVCTHCRHVILLADDCEETRCAACSAELLFLPDAKFIARDLPLFAELERIVDEAALSKSDAALIAADLEGVNRRWEPPELALAQLRLRLPELGKVLATDHDYSRLLLLVAMLLTIVGARLAFDVVAPQRGLRASSGFRELSLGFVTPAGRAARRRGSQSN
jgi:hypothetical protein